MRITSVRRKAPSTRSIVVRYRRISMICRRETQDRMDRSRMIRCANAIRESSSRGSFAFVCTIKGVGSSPKLPQAAGEKFDFSSRRDTKFPGAGVIAGEGRRRYGNRCGDMLCMSFGPKRLPRRIRPVVRREGQVCHKGLCRNLANRTGTGFRKRQKLFAFGTMDERILS